jgi:hypothetical protein
LTSLGERWWFGEISSANNNKKPTNKTLLTSSTHDNDRNKLANILFICVNNEWIDKECSDERCIEPKQRERAHTMSKKQKIQTHKTKHTTLRKSLELNRWKIDIILIETTIARGLLHYGSIQMGLPTRARRSSPTNTLFGKQQCVVVFLLLSVSMDLFVVCNDVSKQTWLVVLLCVVWTGVDFFGWIFFFFLLSGTHLFDCLFQLVQSEFYCLKHNNSLESIILKRFWPIVWSGIVLYCRLATTNVPARVEIFARRKRWRAAALSRQTTTFVACLRLEIVFFLLFCGYVWLNFVWESCWRVFTLLCVCVCRNNSILIARERKEKTIRKRKPTAPLVSQKACFERENDGIRCHCCACDVWSVDAVACASLVSTSVPRDFLSHQLATPRLCFSSHMSHNN